MYSLKQHTLCLCHVLAVVQIRGCSILELVYKASSGAVPFIQAALERYSHFSLLDVLLHYCKTCIFRMPYISRIL